MKDRGMSSFISEMLVGNAKHLIEYVPSKSDIASSQQDHFCAGPKVLEHGTGGLVISHERFSSTAHKTEQLGSFPTLTQENMRTDMRT